MDKAAVILIFGILGVIGLVVGLSSFGGVLFLNDNYADTDGVVIEVLENEVTLEDGSTSGGNATVVVMDGFAMFGASIGIIHVAFFLVVWAVMALAMVASLAGLTD